MNYEHMETKLLLKSIKEKDEIILKLEKKLKESLYYASRDAVTELLNRRAGLSLLEKEIEISKINGTSITICFIDIDGFKYINDNYGHIKGDKVLKDVGNVLKRSVRKTDIVMRIGGDEFVIVFCNTKIDNANRLWRGIDEQINKLNKETYYNYNISLSYGFSEYSSESLLSIKELLHNADKSMYSNKRSN
ncbi:GGDEF domain-containing protein [Clostridium algidicarnis]|uniref:GGDEF domain-containing protein n=1 Tax=Clostridium algidicarnis TaxID=37659 RepID=UPI00162422F5|nr:GGDEF domain-containing protein [Clostridium algidicarnis]MBB6696555.1 GGDEF domain-containing protein [Clostridium algidicarnis]MBU3205877.1 GGDEF domain-containing protein [Clostridium algidicarnis]